MNEKLSTKMNKNRIIGILLFIIICGAAFFIFKLNQKAETEVASDTMEFSAPTNISEIELSDFNPNDLDKQGWVALGFTENQAGTILNWKDVLGGSFGDKAQLKKCYAISPEKYAEIESYIQLPETKAKNFKQNNYQQYTPQGYTPKNQVQAKGKFNPDSYTAADWQGIGFSEKQAISIVKYKNYLGGSFISKEKFEECFMISPENYAKLSPYLILPENTPESFNQNTYSKTDSNLKTENNSKQKITYSQFNPNNLDQSDWMNLGFSEKQAASILKYKNNVLRGSFKNLDEIKACYMITEAKFEEMKPYIVLEIANGKNNEASTDNLKPQKSETNFAGLDLNEITADQLMDFGFDKRTANGFVGFRKSLGGFVNKNQIFETYNIDRELAEKLVATASLNASKAQKYTLVNAPESWLKTHPYFKYSADKIIFYRISNPEDKKIWKFLATKPEYENKMKLYLLN
ncbi:hypothetical protein [Frigoriflavimonas asaccharolytica]|uniref:Helix-hairpin-helix protein n=1 Tax=Frigoriflavimonas asaccharolytica TaxID=2735899 RepID=A0A8J8G8C3_9FLAO|nr:hypothetical protein [Frigoriflavimonas asaccharolytica]NRS91797.1 hypothetical protein [Frigoriflavimonas asaccharolytica]